MSAIYCPGDHASCSGESCAIESCCQRYGGEPLKKCGVCGCLAYEWMDCDEDHVTEKQTISDEQIGVLGGEG